LVINSGSSNIANSQTGASYKFTAGPSFVVGNTKTLNAPVLGSEFNLLLKVVVRMFLNVRCSWKLGREKNYISIVFPFCGYSFKGFLLNYQYLKLFSNLVSCNGCAPIHNPGADVIKPCTPGGG